MPTIQMPDEMPERLDWVLGPMPTITEVTTTVQRAPTRAQRERRRPEPPPPPRPEDIRVLEVGADGTAIRVIYNTPGVDARQCILYAEGGFGEGRTMAVLADVMARHLQGVLNVPAPPPSPQPEVSPTLGERMFNLLGLMSEFAEFQPSIEAEWIALRGEYERYTGERRL